jgi:hypothetical protein
MWFLTGCSLIGGPQATFLFDHAMGDVVEDLHLAPGQWAKIGAHPTHRRRDRGTP